MNMDDNVMYQAFYNTIRNSTNESFDIINYIFNVLIKINIQVDDILELMRQERFATLETILKKSNINILNVFNSKKAIENYPHLYEQLSNYLIFKYKIQKNVELIPEIMKTPILQNFYLKYTLGKDLKLNINTSTALKI